MKKTVLVMVMRHRRETAVKVQKIMTEHGCIIKTRLGIHDGVLDTCSDVGLIILELAGGSAEKRTLAKKLNTVQEVKAKLVDISL